MTRSGQGKYVAGSVGVGEWGWGLTGSGGQARIGVRFVLSHISESRCGAPMFCPELRAVSWSLSYPTSQNRDVGHPWLF